MTAPNFHKEDWGIFESEPSIETPDIVSSTEKAIKSVLANKHEPVSIKHDQDKTPLAILPVRALETVARVMKGGAKKYGQFNYLAGGFSHIRLLSATLRHIFEHLKGNTIDKEFGERHLAHAVCGLLMLIENIELNSDVDDRFVPTPKNKA